MDPALIGGLAGGLIGLAGGAFGTYLGIRSAHGPRERELLIRAAALAWGLVLAFLGLLMLLPRPYGWLLWIPYAIGLPLAARWTTRRQLRIRAQESASEPPK